MVYVEITTQYLVIRSNVTVIAWHYLDECAECRIWHHTNANDFYSDEHISNADAYDSNLIDKIEITMHTHVVSFIAEKNPKLLKKNVFD